MRVYDKVDLDKSTTIQLPDDTTLIIEVENNDHTHKFVGDIFNFVITSFTKCTVELIQNKETRPGIRIQFKNGKTYVITYFRNFFARNVAYEIMKFGVFSNHYPNRKIVNVALTQVEYFNRLTVNQQIIINDSNYDFRKSLIKTFDFRDGEINNSLKLSFWDFPPDVIKSMILSNTVPFNYQDMRTFLEFYAMIINRGPITSPNIGKIALCEYLWENSSIIK